MVYEFAFSAIFLFVIIKCFSFCKFIEI